MRRRSRFPFREPAEGGAPRAAAARTSLTPARRGVGAPPSARIATPSAGRGRPALCALKIPSGAAKFLPRL